MFCCRDTIFIRRVLQTAGGKTSLTTISKSGRTHLSEPYASLSILDYNYRFLYGYNPTLSNSRPIPSLFSLPRWLTGLPSIAKAITIATLCCVHQHVSYMTLHSRPFIWAEFKPAAQQLKAFFSCYTCSLQKKKDKTEEVLVTLIIVLHPLYAYPQ